MILTKEQIKEFETLSKPMIKFLCDNCHPHVAIIVTSTTSEILSGSASIRTEEFLKD